MEQRVQNLLLRKRPLGVFSVERWERRGSELSQTLKRSVGLKDERCFNRVKEMTSVLGGLFPTGRPVITRQTALAPRAARSEPNETSCEIMSKSVWGQLPSDFLSRFKRPVTLTCVCAQPGTRFRCLWSLLRPNIPFLRSWLTSSA